MPLPARRLMPQARIPDLLDWLDAPWPALLPFGSNATFRVEDYVDDGKYMIRAELPGVDPQDDVEVTVESGLLTIRAERREEGKKDRHSEFRYGSLSRTVSLPEGADSDKITARYDQGILEVTVPVPDRAKKGPRQITVKRPAEIPARRRSLPSGPGEQVADRRRKYGRGVLLRDQPRPDRVRARVHEGYAGGDQPRLRQVGPEGAGRAATFQQRRDCLVGCLVGPADRLGAELLGHRLRHGAVAGEVLPGQRDHALQGDYWRA